MAIDTAEKRRAVAGVNPVFNVGVTPNSNEDIEWRYQVAYSYYFGEPTPDEPTSRRVLIAIASR